MSTEDSPPRGELATADEGLATSVYLVSFLGTAALAQLCWELVPFVASLLMFTAPAPLAMLYRAGGVDAGIRGTALALGVLAVVCPAIALGLAGAYPASSPGMAWLIASGATLHAQLLATGAILGLAMAGRIPVPAGLAAATVAVSLLVVVNEYGLGDARELGRQAHAMLTGAKAPVKSPAAPARPGRPAPDIERELAPLKQLMGQKESSEELEWMRWSVLWSLQVPVLMMGMSGLCFVGAAAVFVKWWAVRRGSAPWNWEFGEWRLPWTYSWTLIAAGLMLALAFAVEDLWWISFWSQCLMLAFIPYGILVFSIAYNFMERWRFPPSLRILFYLVILFHSTFLCFLALLDPWADFRTMKFTTGEGGGDDGESD